MEYTLQEQLDIVLLFGACDRHYARTTQEYARRYPDRRHPGELQVRNLIRRFIQTGNLHRRRGRGRPRQGTGEENERRVQRIVQENPHVSTRAIAIEAGTSQTSVWRILHRLRFHPFKLHLHQELHGEDFRKRVEFSGWLDAELDEDPTFLSRVLWTDEASFSRNGCVNLHNAHYWSQTNPHWLRMTGYQERWSVNVWCGILDDRLLGPFFLPGRLTGAIYLQFLQTTLEDALDGIPLERVRSLYYQHDGAPVHASLAAVDYLDQRFPGKWIGRRGPIPWPPRSPDLSPLDFFLWGTLKDRVYQTAPPTPEELRNRIVRECRNITSQVLHNVRVAERQRIRACIASDGHHFEHTF